MAKPQREMHRFLFDNSFDPPKKPAKKAKPEDEKPPEPTFNKQQLEEARDQGYEHGLAAGAAEAAAATEAEVARLVGEIAGRLPLLNEAQALANERLLHDGAQLAAAIMGKILPSLVARSGLEEIDALIRQCLRTLIDQPKIVVRVAAQHAEEISTRLAQAASEGRFDGRFLVEADDAMGLSDCYVTWQAGGLERKADAVWQEMERAVERFLAACPPGGGDPAPPAMQSPEDTGPGAEGAVGPDASNPPEETLNSSEE